MTNKLPLIFNDRHILPTGRIPLRITNQQQRTTILHVMKNNLELGVCMEETRSDPTIIGTRVTIEDFNLSNENILTIMVGGKDAFLIEDKTTEDGIIFANYHLLPSWPQCHIGVDSEPLAEKLESMFERYPELCSLHEQPKFDDLTWLCQRWLELLPLPACEKQHLMAASSCIDTAEYLLSLMKEPH